MTAFHAWLERLTIERTEQQLSPAAVALRIIHSSFVDRFGLARLEAWLEVHEWDGWGGAPTGNGVEEYVKRCGVPVMEGEGLQAKFVPGTWRGGTWVKSANVAPETDVTPEQASALISDLTNRLAGILGPLATIVESEPR